MASRFNGLSLRLLYIPEGWCYGWLLHQINNQMNKTRIISHHIFNNEFHCHGTFKVCSFCCPWCACLMFVAQIAYSPINFGFCTFQLWHLSSICIFEGLICVFTTFINEMCLTAHKDTEHWGHSIGDNSSWQNDIKHYKAILEAFLQPAAYKKVQIQHELRQEHFSYNMLHWVSSQNNAATNK